LNGRLLAANKKSSIREIIMSDVTDAPVARGADKSTLSKIFEAANHNEIGLTPEFKAHGKRMIMLDGPVTREKADVICLNLLNLSLEKPGQDILFYINSPGGSVTAGMAIYDMMRRINCDVRTVGIGQCASMGAFLLAAGTKGKRSVFPGTQVMLHQPSAGAEGKVSDMVREITEFVKIKTRMTRLFEHFMDIGQNDCETLLDRNTYMNAVETQKLGLVDKIVAKIPLENQPLTEDEKKLFAVEMKVQHEELAADRDVFDIIMRREQNLLPVPVPANDPTPAPMAAPRLAS
jgi:ATP-dependent Clp protease protease subunit